MRPCTQFAFPIPFPSMQTATLVVLSPLNIALRMSEAYPTIERSSMLDALQNSILRAMFNGDKTTRVAVCMEGKGMGMQTGTGAHTIGLQVGNENRYAYEHCRATKEASVVQ